MEPDDDTVPLVDFPSARVESSEARPSGESHYLHESMQPESQDAADSTSPLSSAETNLYGPSPQLPQVSAAVESVAEVGSQPDARKRYVQANLAALGILVILLSITIIFSTWLGIAIKRKIVMNDEGNAIFSWSMNQKTAKIIESMWNAVISPVIFFIFDAFLFRVARVTMISEKTSRTVALRPLVAASSTDAGTYNPIKIWGIVRKSRSRLLPFAVLTVLSGVSLGSISNVVAYEAYTKSAGETSVLLRTLNGIESRSTLISPPSQFSTTEQLANFTGQVNGMLTAISYQNADDKLESDSYVGVNATTASLNALPTEIIRLYNVPGYKLSIGCQAQPPNVFDPAQMGDFEVSIALVASDGYLFKARYPGQLATMGSEWYDPFRFIGFRPDKMELYLGCALRFNQSAHKTPYGEMTFKSFEMPQREFIGTKKLQSVSGLRCKVTRQTGWHNFTREKDLAWKRTASVWDGPNVDTPLTIADWQVALNFHGPANSTGVGLEPGIGPKLGAKIYGSSQIPFLYPPSSFPYFSTNTHSDLGNNEF